MLGEYGDISNIDLLLTLSDYNSIKVKSSALNALGKINEPEKFYSNIIIIKKIDSLKNIKTDYAGFYKDIVFCLRNYESEKSYMMLLEFIKSDYHYSIRFPASNALKEFNKKYSYLITRNIITNLANDEIAIYALVNTLAKVNDKEFERIYNEIESIPLNVSAPIKYAVTNVIKERLKAGFSSEHTEYLVSKLNRLNGL
jgi:hypothetical protein